MRLMKTRAAAAAILTVALAFTASAVPVGSQGHWRGRGAMMGDTGHQADMQLFHALPDRGASITRTVRKLSTSYFDTGLFISAPHPCADPLRIAEPGADCFDRRSKAQITRRLIKRLEGLGVTVEVRPAA